MTIKELWFIVGIALFVMSFFKNISIIRLISIGLFLLFIIFASCRGINFNPDTKNYVDHFSSFINSEFNIFQLFSWNWEVGYNVIAIILAHVLNNKDIILFFITLIPGLIFSFIFYKYKYHPAIIFYIYASIVLVATTATMRHWWALSISFLVLNHVILLNRNKIIEFFYPIFFHYSTIPLVLVLFINKWRKIFRLKYILLIMFFIISIFIFGKSFFISLYNHFLDRALSGGIRLISFRNLNNLFLVFLILFSFKKLSINLSRLDFLLIISIIITLVLMPFYGINRIVSFFTLVILVYLHKYKCTKEVNFATISLSFISLISLIYFYFNYSITT